MKITEVYVGEKMFSKITGMCLTIVKITPTHIHYTYNETSHQYKDGKVRMLSRINTDYNIDELLQQRRKLILSKLC